MKQALFGRIKRFIDISEEEKTLIDSLFHFKSWDKGEYFLAQGGFCKEIGFLIKGF